ncbi:met-10+ like protein, putative [Plasmodium ovale wallikeri]|uniref:tRNA (guanine(37)-N1)-methyltransferase n=1 Tax=Plasmodium ovale wallikeri TaxID=864142 RepID=A0A1A9AJU2_PLAOA|nr:met-10+ like protein, putative [Plasmodium ovale wallikeri]SBT56483.1 met-10+ like protein, putative [Plasmodium ovale wallikeri]
MSPLSIKSLNDVKEKLKYKKKTYCLLVNKYKANEILKNKYVKFWLLSVYKFPSVLLYEDYKEALLVPQEDGDENAKNILASIYSYFESIPSEEKINQGEHDCKSERRDTISQTLGTVGGNSPLSDSPSEADCRIIPLNEYFDKIVGELFLNKGRITTEKELLFHGDSAISIGKEEKCYENKTCRVNSYTNSGVIRNDDENDLKKKNIINNDNFYEINEEDIKRDINELGEEREDIVENMYNANKITYLEELYKIIKKENIKLEMITLHFGYENMNTSEILRKIFPSISEIIHKFEIIGHIAHLNFCDKLESCKKIIAEIILDKNKSIKTVINKKDILNNLHRTFTIELLAGEKNYITELKENNIKVKLNYELMYWNSKLKKERDRIYSIVGNNSIIVDVFAGVGIFSLQLSKKSCLCFSNDINEHAYNYMNINIHLNKRKNILTYNLDGREFLEKIFDLNIFSKGNSPISISVDKQNMKNISVDVLNSSDHDIFQKIMKKRKNEHLVRTTGKSAHEGDLLGKKKKNNQLSLINAEAGETYENGAVDETCENGAADEKEGPIDAASYDHTCYTDNKCNQMGDNNLLTGNETKININFSGQNVTSVDTSAASNNPCNNLQKGSPDNGDNSNTVSKDEVQHVKNASSEEPFSVDINLNIYNDVHVLMNLPQTALDFLDVFKKLKKKKKEEIDKMRNIFIHCYYFSKPEFFYEHAERNILLHFQALPKEMKITEIRKVSPNKLMYVVEFNLKELLEK